MAAPPQSSFRANLLLIAGSDQDERQVSGLQAIAGAGATDIHQLIDRHEPYHRMHVTKQFFRNNRQPDLLPYRCLLNLITDPDQNPKVLENLRRVLRGYPGKVLNRPEAVLRSTRDQVARLLAGTPGLIVPKAIRIRTPKPNLAAQMIGKAGLRFPLILRAAGSHGGEIVGKFETLEELQRSLGGSGEHIATEFVDFRSADGLYRKYRVFFLGPHVVFRHMLASDHWNIHAKDRMRFMVHRPELLTEEQALFAAPEQAFPPGVRETLGAVNQRMPLDYFGMDFGIAPDGEVVLFEANATMNFFPFLSDPRFAYVKACLEPAQKAFDEMIGAAPRQEHRRSLAERLTA